ncbi:MAG TPA: cupredoxin domain-containing protein, partial [Thermoleophilia bacterium]|nr:cupredoxin domain-containing protein [Thermoleophilia bacterium]
GAAPAANREQRIVITVTKNGFEPASVHLKAGKPVRLVVTRRVERTCATDIVVKEYGIKKPLPLNKPVEVRFTPRKSGAIRYACAMDMIAGSLIVE